MPRYGDVIVPQMLVSSAALVQCPAPAVSFPPPLVRLVAEQFAEEDKKVIERGSSAYVGPAWRASAARHTPGDL